MLLYQISLLIYSETICAAIFGLSETISLNMCNSDPFPAYITIHTDYFISCTAYLRKQVQYKTTVIKMNHQLCNCLQGFLFPFFCLFVNFLNSINWLMKKEA